MTTGGTLWAWMVDEGGERGWNMIGGYVPGVGHIPLCTGSEKVAELMEPVAMAHYRRTGRPVRLLRFDAPIIMKDLQ